MGGVMKSGDKVCLGWIDGGQVEGAFAASVFHTACVHRERIDQLIRVEGHLLSRQRNELVWGFLERSKAPWLLMLDTDHSFTPEDFDRLCAAAHEVSFPVLSGLYFGAYPSDGLMPLAVPIAYCLDPEGQYRPIMEWQRGKLIRVDAVGGGMLLVHRRVLEALRDASEHPDWAWFADGPTGNAWYSEDVTFCQRVRAAGFPIHVHPDVELPHLKQFWLTGQHFRAQQGL